MNLKTIQTKAAKNRDERLSIINSLVDEMDKDKSLIKKINKIDKTFVRKIFHFPGDITSHRIAKVLQKVSELP